MNKPQPHIPIPSRRQGAYGDQVRINARHYGPLCQLADEGGYTSLGQLLAAILDAALPRVKLVSRPQYDITIVDDQEEE